MTTIRYDPDFDDNILSIYVRVERDGKVWLPPVWCLWWAFNDRYWPTCVYVWFVP